MAAAGWPPLLLLALLVLSPSRPETGDIVLKAPTQVHGFLGDSVTLPCQLQLPSTEVTHVSQLTWTRLSDSRSVAVFHRTQGPNYPESERLEFVAARLGAELWDASLRVLELRAEDEGNYTCLFVMFPQGSRSAVTWLRVFAKPQNTAEAQNVQLTGEPVPVARCISTGGRPPARITWYSDLGGMANMSQEPGLLSGTVTVTSLWILVPSSQVDGKNVTCRVEHESFEKPQLLAVNLTVYYPPEVSISGYDGNWYLGQTEASLTCDAHSNPEPTGYEWSTTMGPLPPSAVAQGAQLLIHPVDKSINTTFICNVTSALGARQAELTVQVKEGPSSEPPGMPKNNILLLILGPLVVLALLGFGLYFYWSRCSQAGILLSCIGWSQILDKHTRHPCVTNVYSVTGSGTPCNGRGRTWRFQGPDTRAYLLPSFPALFLPDDFPSYFPRSNGCQHLG
ncbi:poliovirus receptor isoform X1 [Sapajus apella]|uniref:Poliovirus receptor isoform X1 n=1 Tax=Sapajus apella TaxID=9515 RepID=A0A6J3GKL5_SAPAP|nr:poliovirus receptor isoform X1 [Sapajus apella]XP_032118599.1 poliovirus receptor isoform X1 [Sapajus apella]XP_032118600.1 poliovirus receptor isoform X1 [Sapajus apella]